MLGAGTVLAGWRKTSGAARASPSTTSRALLALLATAYDRPVDVRLLAKMRRAAELWNEGEKALAHIHVAHASLPPCGEEQALRLFVADELIEAGVAPAALMKAQGFDPAPLALLKYSPDQPRVPAGSGRESGQWTSGDSVGVSAPPAAGVPASLPPAAAAGEGAGTLAADLFAGASPRFLAGLAEFGAIIGGAGAVLGAIFIPSPNPGLTSEGAVPGDPGLRYAIDHDEGTLRLTRQDSTGAELAVVAKLGRDGVFHEVETGTPIARDMGGSIVFDAASLAIATAPEETSRTSDTAVTAAEADAKENSPKLCPDPGPDAPHGASERAQRYQELISALNNPQRPLPAGLAVSLINPVTGAPVVFDDCRESDGTMIEAKGPGYANRLESAYLADIIAGRWERQARRQLQASGGRALEWYFADEKAARLTKDATAKSSSRTKPRDRQPLASQASPRCAFSRAATFMMSSTAATRSSSIFLRISWSGISTPARSKLARKVLRIWPALSFSISAVTRRRAKSSASAPVLPSFPAAQRPSLLSRRALALNFSSSSWASFASKACSRSSKVVMILPMALLHLRI